MRYWDATQPSIPPEVREWLDDEKRGHLRALREAMESIEWTPEAIHSCIHDTAAGLEVKAGQMFGLLYRIFIGQKKGPRLGYFLGSLDRGFVLGRVGDAQIVD